MAAGRAGTETGRGLGGGSSKGEAGEGQWKLPTASYIHQTPAFPCGSVLDYVDEFHNFEFGIKSEDKWEQVGSVQN